jgi:hypothetical protein
MNVKRRAELQRKLSLTAVPRPPAGLAERIKADIPKYLTAEVERQRLNRSMTLNFRIAASVILLVSSVLVTMHLLREGDPNVIGLRTAMAPPPARMAAPQRAANVTTSTPTSDEVRVEIAQEPASVPPSALLQPPVPAPRVRERDAAPLQLADASSRQRNEAVSSRDAREDLPAGVAGSVEGGVAGGVIGTHEKSVPQMAESVAPPPPPVAAPAAVSPMETPEPRLAKTADSRSLVREAYADNLDLAPRRAVFGISVDADVFHRIKTTLENGGRPAADRVNVDALVNYFAGAPAKPPKHGVRLEVEASPAPVQTAGNGGIVRFTVDTEAIALADGASTPPVAKDAALDVEIDANAVTAFHRIGETDNVASESTLLQNVSVTGLYALDLKSGLRAMQHVATIRLHYTSVSDGKKHTIERVIRAGDFTRPWTAASRRHRLASLGAVWGESLKGTGGGVDVARRAQELASQNPRDARAKELAAAADASSRAGS